MHANDVICLFVYIFFYLNRFYEGAELLALFNSNMIFINNHKGKDLVKNKYNLLILSTVLAASTHAKEYVVNLGIDVPEFLEVELIDESGNPAPISTSMNYQLNPDPNGGQVLNATGIFKNYRLKSNVRGANFAVTRSLSPLTVPSNVNADSIITQLSVVSSDCDETGVTAPVRLPSNQQTEMFPTVIKDGGRLCETRVDHEYLNNLFPAGTYSSELKITIDTSL